jgi:hypothetical protein
MSHYDICTCLFPFLCSALPYAVGTANRSGYNIYVREGGNDANVEKESFGSFGNAWLSCSCVSGSLVWIRIVEIDPHNFILFTSVDSAFVCEDSVLGEGKGFRGYLSALTDWGMLITDAATPANSTTMN